MKKVEKLNTPCKGRKAIKEHAARPSSGYTDSFIHIYNQIVLQNVGECRILASSF